MSARARRRWLERPRLAAGRGTAKIVSVLYEQRPCALSAWPCATAGLRVPGACSKPVEPALRYGRGGPCPQWRRWRLAHATALAQTWELEGRRASRVRAEASCGMKTFVFWLGGRVQFSLRPMMRNRNPTKTRRELRGTDPTASGQRLERQREPCRRATRTSHSAGNPLHRPHRRPLIAQ